MSRPEPIVACKLCGHDVVREIIPGKGGRLPEMHPECATFKREVERFLAAAEEFSVSERALKPAIAAYWRRALWRAINYLVFERDRWGRFGSPSGRAHPEPLRDGRGRFASWRKFREALTWKEGT